MKKKRGESGALPDTGTTKPTGLTWRTALIWVVVLWCLGTFGTLLSRESNGSQGNSGANGGRSFASQDNSAVVVTVQTETLNVRAGPSTDYRIIGRLTAGEVVHATGCNSNRDWFAISYQGRSAWISGDSRLVSVQGDADALRLVAAPALPTQALPPAVQSGQGAQQPPAAPAAPCNCNVWDYNCDNFSTHAAAQGCWNACGGNASNNLWDLDRDHDGVACESLP